ncbi:MAG: hemerythrin family protein [Bacteroidales bacterium]|nr:hemerythrin family protein [Bacteroidales bacterium]
MTIIQWKEEFSVGVIEIDHQHKKIVSLINQLFDAMKKGEANAVLGSIISELVFYAQSHFKTEERYFDQFNYIDTAKHKREHQSFVSDVSKFKADFDSGKITLSIGVFNFLQNWLHDHILGEDKKYTECFNKNGVF